MSKSEDLHRKARFFWAGFARPKKGAILTEKKLLFKAFSACYTYYQNSEEVSDEGFYKF
jgi:hypothetical protein